MNLRFVANQLGLLLVIFSGFILAIALWELAATYLFEGQEKIAMNALLVSAGIGILVGGGLWFAGKNRRADSVTRREALLLVSLSWIVGAALGACPYFFWAMFELNLENHVFHNFIDCYFEAMSGLTTTGATVLSDIEALPSGLLFWRAFTHWIGGLGIVVMFVAVFPALGVGGKKIFHVESAGPTAAGVKPRIIHTARVLWVIYVTLTVVQTLILWATGMSLFDSFCHTFATLGTGGFSTQNASIAGYSGLQMWIIIFFMFFAGMNFGLYYQAIQGSFKTVWRDVEFRFYLALIIGGAGIILFALIMENEPLVMATGEQANKLSTGDATTHSFFTAISILTTTGFGTADFNLWPVLAKSVLVLFMFIGGCAGSTAGGIKVIRVWIVLKIVWDEMRKVFQPNVISPMRLGKATVDHDMKMTVVVYVLGIVLLFGIGTVAVMMFESGNPKCDFTTAATASVATLCTIGPGLNAIGATENYGWMTSSSKTLLSIWMAFGRLEVFAILVLFMPGFWKVKWK